MEVQNLRSAPSLDLPQLESVSRAEAPNDSHWEPTCFLSWHHLHMLGIGPHILTLFYNHFGLIRHECIGLYLLLEVSLTILFQWVGRGEISQSR